jgi:hypothetical protein
METHRHVRRRGSHIFLTMGSDMWKVPGYVPAIFLPQGTFLAIIYFISSVDPRAIGDWKKLHCPKQLRYRMPPEVLNNFLMLVLL